MSVAAIVEETKQLEVTPDSRVASYAPVRRPLVWFGRVTQEFSLPHLCLLLALAVGFFVIVFFVHNSNENVGIFFVLLLVAAVFGYSFIT